MVLLKLVVPMRLLGLKVGVVIGLGASVSKINYNHCNHRNYAPKHYSKKISYV